MKFRQILLSAIVVVPLHKKGAFKELVYSSLPKHELKFLKDGLNIKVNKSAMPLIYPLRPKQKIISVKIKGHVDKLIPLKTEEIQGSKADKNYVDDYIFRLGLVLEGDKTLNWFQKKIAPKWVLELYSLAPDGEGVDKIIFYNVTQQKSALNKKNIHPLGKGLMHEINQWHIEKPGDFEFEVKPSLNQKVHALWLSIDGDNSKAVYNIKLKEITLITGE
jgi:hypothetical protein